MRKKALPIIIFFMIISLFVSANEISQLIGNIVHYKVVINDHEQQFENPVVIINDRTYVPLREVAEALNMNVDWSEDEQKITINEKGKYTGDGSDLFVFKKDGLYGFMDTNGKVWIEPKLEYAYFTFREGYGIVEKRPHDDSWNIRSGTIDVNGNLVIPYKFYSIGPFFEGLANAIEQHDGEEYFIDNDGKNVFGKTFPRAGHFSCGLAPVIKKGYPWPTEHEKWTYIDKTGNYVTDMEFDDVQDFSSNGFSAVKKNGKLAIIDKNFNKVTDYIYDDVLNFSDDGYIVAKKSGKCGVINTNGETIIDFTYDHLRGFYEGLCATVKDGKYGYIDINDNAVIPFRYKWALEFSYDIASVQDENGKWGIINKKGEYVLEPKYDNISTCDRGLIEVTELPPGVEFGQIDKDLYTYYINTKFENLVPH